jgi:hypothetical protein
MLSLKVGDKVVKLETAYHPKNVGKKGAITKIEQDFHVTYEDGSGECDESFLFELDAPKPEIINDMLAVRVNATHYVSFHKDNLKDAMEVTQLIYSFPEIPESSLLAFKTTCDYDGPNTGTCRLPAKPGEAWTEMCAFIRVDHLNPFDEDMGDYGVGLLKIISLETAKIVGWTLIQ